MADKSLNLLQKLSIIRSQAKVKKTGKNAFAKFEYYEITQIYGVLNPLFEKYGVFSTFDLMFLPELNMYRGTLTLINVDDMNDKIVQMIDAPLNNVKGASEAQKVGSNNTYMLRYLLMNSFMLDNGAGDPDSHEPQDDKPSKPDYSSKMKELTKKIDDGKKLLSQCKTLDELRYIFLSLPEEVKKQKGILKIKDSLKESLAIATEDVDM